MHRQAFVFYLAAAMRTFLLFLVTQIIPVIALGQHQVTLSLNEKGTDRYFETSKLIAPVFKLKGDTIESYQGFGIKNNKPLQRFKVQAPEFTAVMDTGYTFLFSKLSTESINGYTAVLVANYSRRHLPAILYVDHNNNFDFTDDGDPDTFYLALNHIDIEIRNPEQPEQRVLYRLSRFSFTKDFAFKRIADELFTEHAGSKQFAGTSFSFREQRFNIRVNDCTLMGDSFQVALQDMNYNGLYNEPGIDRILVNSYKSKLVGNDHGFEIGEAKEKTYFERSFKSYKVLAIDSFGKFIRFELDTSKVASRQLLEGEKVPKIKFTDANGDKQKLRWYGYKPVYIYFWNREQEGFEEDTAALRLIQEKFCPMVKVIALNYGDNPKMLSSYVDVNNVHYLTGVATKTIIQQYQIEEVPYGFLLQKRLRLYQKGLRPIEVLEMLERGEIQSW